MKKIVLLALAAASLLPVQAQRYYQMPKFGDNWSLGIDAGVATPLKDHAFFGDMRAALALHVQKQLSPVFALGVEGTFGINTSSWIAGDPGVKALGYDLTGNSTAAIDNFYVGAYGAVNLFNLFGGYNCGRRLFDIEAQAGAGWGYNDAMSQNYFATKAGLNFNFNLSRWFTLSLRPAVTFNMTGTEYAPLDVEVEVAILRSITLNDYLRVLVVLQVRSYHLNVGLLVSCDLGAADFVENVTYALEVIAYFLNNFRFAVLASLEFSLESRHLSLIGCG